MNESHRNSASSALIGLLSRPSPASDDAGNALIEVALILAFFCTPLLVGTGEMGLLIYDSIQIQDAAHAGAAYAMQSATFAANTAGIRTAAQQDAPEFGTDLTVTPTIYYVCSASINGSQHTTLASATSACTGTSNHPLQFVKVLATTSVTPALHCPGFGSSFTVAAVSAMEIEQ
jgi:Flp pilus assembly protein TadG